MTKKILLSVACCLLIAGCGGSMADGTGSGIANNGGNDNAPTGAVTQETGRQVDLTNGISPESTAKSSSDNAP